MAVALGGAPPRRVGRPFYLIMSLLLAAIVVFGFSHTVPGDLAAPGLPPLLQLHAAVFAAWVLLFVAQPSLVARGSLALHRRLGWVGVGLACAMVAMGAAAVLFALWSDSIPPFYPHGFFLVRGLFGLALFAGLTTAGALRRREAEWHKRLMLCAAISVIVPGLERALPIPLFGAAWPFYADGAADLIALAGPATDLAIRGRVHPAYVWGVGAIVGGQAMVYLVSASPLAPILLASVHAH